MLEHGLSGGNGMHGSQLLSDQMFNMGAANPGNTIPTQQQQQQHHSTQGAVGNFVTGNSWSCNTANYECHGGEGISPAHVGFSEAGSWSGSTGKEMVKNAVKNYKRPRMW